MVGVNRVILLGYLGQDPEVHYFDRGATVAKFSLATSEIIHTKDGQKLTQTEWHHVVMWQYLADRAAKYLKKGKLIYIEGKLRTRSFDNKEGHKITITEVIADHFTMLSNKNDVNKEIVDTNKQEEETMNYEDSPDDNLPF